MGEDTTSTERICADSNFGEKIATDEYVEILYLYDDVIKGKHFPRNWPFVRGIQRCPVNSPHKGQWLGALMLPRLNKRLRKQSEGWWFETLFGPLWRHCNGIWPPVCDDYEATMSMPRTWISNCIHALIWDVISHTRPNFTAFEVKACMSNYTPLSYMDIFD